MSMMESILRKIQLHFNIDELREVDDDTIDDDVRKSSSGVVTVLAGHLARGLRAQSTVDPR